MADIVRGKIVWQNTKSGRARRVVFPTRKGMSIPTPYASDQITASLENRTDDEIEVELEVVGGKPVRIRPVGEPFATKAVSQSSQPQSRPPRGQQGLRPQSRQQRQNQGALLNDPAFHNPYNFVPALPRDRVTGELGDHEPLGHHAFHPDHYSGVICVKMTAHTPLLLPDAAQAENVGNDHKSFPVRVDTEGKPFIPPTSIKGMLRAAYEAITNSRLAVFAEHGERLADRMPARDGLLLVPARVDGNQIELLPGTSTIQATGQPSGPMYAAWLPRYDARTGRAGGRNCVSYPDETLPQHGDKVTCWIVEVRHRSGRFSFWRVNRVFRQGQATGEAPLDARQRQVDGYVCVTNRNIDRKHDERIFFTTQRPIRHPLTEELSRQWRELIANYQTIHEDERRTGQQGPPALSNSVWSRQVTGGAAEQQLTSGTLCYAAVCESQIAALYPVMISRRLFQCSPLSLLPGSCHPATFLTQLSPADRVFGWVKQQGKGAYRGNLRIGPVRCENPTEQAVEHFGTHGLPLAILGQPKPQQARFYVAKNQNGEAQNNGLTKEQAGYSSGKGLRGRKAYPHHRALPDGHWDDPLDDQRYQEAARSVSTREYIRHPESRDSQGKPNRRDKQNRSIQGWVKPGTEFTFDIHLTNLSKVELGALLWLLSLPENHFHRFGGGKPLGFGSVRLEIESSQLHDGNGWKDIYSTLDDAMPSGTDHAALIKEFQEAVRTSYGEDRSFDDVPFIAAWLRMATGHPDSLPTHYPRSSVSPDPAGENFRWFTTNESGPKVSLPNLADDSGLPLLNTPRRGN